ncbi:hypothetical protein RDI58_023806 [Solanum bulbocastanum]|uniref:Uncharacterized protein n=1 Tax=Solanum bulbocastanum TaxID=147425 RepID=A0AAN8SX28_SOLBU
MISQNILLLSSLLLLLLLNLGYASNGPVPGSMKAQKQENMSSRAIVPGFSVREPTELYFPKKTFLYRCLYGCLPPPNITFSKKHHHHHHHPPPPSPSPSPSPSPFPFPPPLNQHHHHHHHPPHHHHHHPPPHRRHQPKPNTIMDQPKPMQKGKQDGH